jgi:hypothetical protein
MAAKRSSDFCEVRLFLEADIQITSEVSRHEPFAVVDRQAGPRTRSTSQVA